MTYKKKILIDILATKDKIAGDSAALINYLDYWTKNKSIKFYILVQKKFFDNIPEYDNIKKIKINLPLYANVFFRILYQQFFMFLLIKKIRPDYFFSFSSVFPILFCSGLKKILFLFDIHYKTSGQRYGFLKKLYLNLFISQSIKNSYMIIVPSNRTKNNLKKYFNIKTKKIKLVPIPVNNIFLQPYSNEINNYVPKEIKNKKYILFVGRKDKGKNIDLLIDCFLEFNKNYPDINLVIVSDARIKKKKNIIILKNIKIKTLIAIYYNCLFYINLSIDEGYCLPLFEALCCNKPILTNKNNALIEFYPENNFLPDLKKETILKFLKDIYHNPLKYKFNKEKFIDKVSYINLKFSEQFLSE